MKRWQCTLFVTALAPAFLTVSGLLIAGPVIHLYDNGQLGASPSTPLAAIVGGAALVSAIALAVTWVFLRAAFTARER